MLSYLIKQLVERELRRNPKFYRSIVAEVYPQFSIDSLTGLYNDWYYRKALEIELERSRRYDRDWSILTIDLVDFKHYNDLYGRKIGNKILRRVGKFLLDNIRKVDTACRISGGADEFVVIIPEIGYSGSLSSIARLEEKFEEEKRRYKKVLRRFKRMFPHYEIGEEVYDDLDRLSMRMNIVVIDEKKRERGIRFIMDEVDRVLGIKN